MIKISEEIKKLRTSGKELAAILKKVASLVEPGITTGELNQVAEELITKIGGTPSFKGYGEPISFPAGLAKMKKSSFYTLTFAGSFFWSLLLTYIGFKLAKKWQIIEAYFREFDIVILIIIILIVVWWIYKHFKNKKI